MNKERVVTLLIMIGLFGGLIGGPITSLADYHAPPETFVVIYYSRIYRLCMYGINGILRKIKKGDS
jgi:hypothetical protein